MADTFNIGGAKISKPVAIGGAGIAVLGGALYLRHRNAQQAANAAVAQAGANNGIDPATGYPYGSQEDAAALSNQGQYVSPVDSSSFTGGQVIGYDGGGNPIYGPTSGIVSGQPGGFTNNAQWAQYVESYLENTEGADPTTVGNAIGKYITGQPLTDSMIAIVQNAIAIGGYPPTQGPNGNPPHYITSSSQTGSGTGTTIIVPNITGMRLADATGALTAAGLRIAGAKQIKGKAEVVTSQNPKAGVSVNLGSVVTVTTKAV